MSQCPKAGSLPSVNATGNKEDVKKVFEFLQGASIDANDPNSLKSNKDKVKGLASESDVLIVPGVRVSSYRLGDDLNKTSQSVKLDKGQLAKDDSYENILALGYVPMRYFVDATSSNIRFAFSQDKKSLKEIKVTDKKYQTADSIGVGVSEKILKTKFKTCEQRGKGELRYWVCKGITFTIKQSAVLACTIFQE